MSTIVIATVLVVGGTTVLRVGYDTRVSNKRDAMFKVVVAGFAMGVILTLVYSAAPTVAVALSWLLIVAALMVNGEALALATKTVFR